jgi:NADPH:quinone reductase-like Zn-dependent oxidoreductase
MKATFSRFGAPDVLAVVALACLAPQGRLVEVSATGRRKVTFDLTDFYRKECRIIGVETLKLDLIAAGDILETPRPGFEGSDYCPPSIAGIFPPAGVAGAYQAVANGQAGRVVPRPRG